MKTVRVGVVLLAVAGMLSSSSAYASGTFGTAVAVGDFNLVNPGTSTRDEIAVTHLGYASYAGLVEIYWRSSSGTGPWVSGDLMQYMLEGYPFTGGWGGGMEASDGFGTALATGDFDGDGFKDLAIGVPGEDLNTKTEGGCVHILFGAASGPWGLPFRAATTMLTRASAFGDPIPNTISTDDRFGQTLAVGDINRDGRDDLIVGAPGVTVNNQIRAGAVFVFTGASSANGVVTFPRASSITLVEGGRFSPAGTPQAYDEFGASLAVGNFNGDLDSFNSNRPFLDLAVGAPGERVGNATSAGTVFVYYGFNNWYYFNTTNNLVSQTSIGYAGEPSETDDRFGRTLAAGNFNSNSVGQNQYVDDLAIGVPNEGLGALLNAGAVHVLYGVSASGLSTSGTQFFSSGDFGASTPRQAGARFGATLASGDVIREVNGGCQGQTCNPQELIIGEPHRQWMTYASAGRAYVLKGQNGASLTTIHSLNNTGPVFGSEMFGYALAVGHVIDNNDGGNIRDVIVGRPLVDRVSLWPGGTPSMAGEWAITELMW